MRRPFSGRSAFGRLSYLPVAIVLGVFLLFAAANASAAVRFAAPGGTASAGSECQRTNPCSLFNAAAQQATNTSLAPGDEIVVEPGTYSKTAGDLGGEGVIIPAFNASIHGVAGKPRPVIRVSGQNGTAAFFLRGSTLRYLEIVSSGQSTPGFVINAGPSTVERVVARGDGSQAPCTVSATAVVRDTVCLTSGSGPALEIGESFSNMTATLRNVTAIATGAGSAALKARAEQKAAVNVDAVGVLARAPAEDVIAEALSQSDAPNTGATITVTLDHSDFADFDTVTDPGGGIATVTEPGTGSNITDPPRLAADGYHQLPGSLTIDKGATDPSSGTTDVDGNQRTIGTADIGADEHGSATMTSLSCTPASVFVGIGSTICTATVSSAGGAPIGAVALASDGPGVLAGDGGCALVAKSATESSCNLAYVPRAIGAGRHQLSAFYPGDAVAEGSEASTSVEVGPVPPPNPPSPPLTPAPNTTLKRKPARRTSSRSATFTFIANQPNASFQCRLDKGRFKPCRSPFRRKVEPGRHSFQVRSVSSGGKADPTPAIYSWRVSPR